MLQMGTDYVCANNSKKHSWSCSGVPQARSTVWAYRVTVEWDHILVGTGCGMNSVGEATHLLHIPLSRA